MPTEAERGSVLAIGGREVRDATGVILKRFLERCGGPDARIVLLTAASEKPDEVTAEYRTAFREAREFRSFHHARRSETGDGDLLTALTAATGVFLAGGNQLKLVTMLGGTPVESKLRERYEQGLHVAGTSAGAAALSAVMIARGRARSAARLGSVQMSPGFGILPRLIIDQHFRERDRFGRLLTAVISNPAMLGLGLDEDTAFDLAPSGRIEVIGRGTLTIVDGSEMGATNLDVVPQELPVAFSGLRLHALTAGWVYQLGTGQVEPPAVDPGRRKPLVDPAA